MSLQVDIGPGNFGSRRSFRGHDVGNYSHTSQAIGGYWSCSFQVPIIRPEISFWLEKSLGAPVTVYGEGGGIAWEGFVNKVSVCFSGMEIVRGPWMDIANKIYVAYQTPAYTVAGVTFGGFHRVTAAATDALSQTLYGIHERVIAGGTLTDTQAENLRDTYLEEAKDPKMDQDVGADCSGGMIAKFECKGWIKAAENYIVSIGSTGDVNVSAKVADVVDAEPNGYWGEQTIVTNTLQVENSEGDNADAWAVLNQLNELGMNTGLPTVMGMFENRRFYYQDENYGWDYAMRLSEGKENIRQFSGGNRISPWFVKAGGWLHIDDYAVTPARAPDDRQSDPSWIFLEEVKYSHPNNLRFAGGSFGTLGQLMRQIRS